MADSPKKYFVKNNKTDKIWWLEDRETLGEWVFSFDRKQTFNMFKDYPWRLTAEQKEIFDRENPYWANFFRDRDRASRSKGKAARDCIKLAGKERALPVILRMLNLDAD